MSCIWRQAIWWVGTSPEALGNMEYSFITIIPRSYLNGSGRTCWVKCMGQIESLMLNSKQMTDVEFIRIT